MKPKNSESYSSDQHNHTWINLNRITAREFSEKYCPYGILAKQINRKLNSGEISYDEIDQMYDPNKTSMMKIKPFHTRIEFSLVWAKDLGKSPECSSIGYEYNPFKFEDILKKAFWRFKELLDNI